MSVSRRRVLQYGGLGVLGAAALSVPVGSIEAKSASRLSPQDRPGLFQAPLTQAPVLEPYAKGNDPEDGAPIHYYSVTETAGTAAILPRLTTPILSYNGVFPGPTISVERGTKAVLRVRNQLPATHPLDGHELSTSTHLHGSASLPEYDGYANDTTPPGFVKDYLYPNSQHARTIWYHDHAVHHTGTNAYSGLAAQYHIHDPLERALLPQGRFDVALTVTDAMFAADGTLAYDDNNHSGLWGDIILVNGAPWPVMKVQRRVYRFRVLNACVSRSFRFTLGNGDPVTVVATDGGLMPAAQTVGEWRHSGGERYEILIDFRNYRPGERIELQNRSNKNNVDYDFTNQVMAFDVTDEPVDTTDPTWNTIPSVLNPNNEIMNLRPEDAAVTRRFRVKRDDVTNLWTIDDQTWASVVASGYRDVIAAPDLNAVEIWEFENNAGGWFHPMHVHLVDFRIIGGEGRPTYTYEEGPKDVAYVGEGETVRLLMQFGPHQGKYMVHCHNLPHEDHDMMVQFRVGPETAPDPHDPMSVDRCYWDDGALPPAYPPAPSYTDVPAGTQFLNEISWLALHGITTGYSDGSYRPVSPVNRDAMAAFMYRLAGSPAFTPPAVSPFRDLGQDNQFYKEITWLAAQGVTTGYPDGTYRYLQSVNRDAMAAFLYRLAGSPAFTPPLVSPFGDVATDNPFYREICWLASVGITTGYPDGTFRPLQPVNRDAMAAFLFRHRKHTGQ